MVSRRQPDYIAVGVIEKAHGIRGQVKVKALTDFPSRFKLLTTIFVELQSGERKQLEIARINLQGQIVYLSFKDINNREQAQELQGAFLMIKRTDLLPLHDDEFYHFEIEGFEVKTEAGVHVGAVEKVWDLAANPVFVVQTENGEVLIPVIKDVIKEIDKKKGEIIITPLEGLLE